MTPLLALDLATATGWAAFDPEADPPVRFGRFRLPPTGKDVGRYLDGFHAYMVNLVRQSEPNLIVFESPILPTETVDPQTGRKRHTAIATLRKLYGLAAFTEWFAHRHSIQVFEANNKSVRKHFIGTGGAARQLAKRLTMEACKARGWDVEMDDEADALALMDYAVHCLRIPAPWACGALYGATA